MSPRNAVDAFLRQVAAAPKPLATGARGRLLFAMDATASREPSWDTACKIQGEMFRETAALGGLDIQLAYYRGFQEFAATPWLSDSETLLRRMTSVTCRGGQTQIERLLRHAAKESASQPVQALVFVGDCFEEDIDAVCHAAGELGLRGVPAFIFHEGGEPLARRAFEEIARLTKGAYCAFDASSAQQLRDLLAAVAVYAAGGRRALENYGRKQGGAALMLTSRLGKA
ncbi:MAG: VWA domain-containing protein [Alphaproteobacteria bacterium]|nr:VWA domain-containing protein [Alphaproteobacteria bacterium]MBU0798548.1 VWA domain-containing protein [Alphaproteobacteria bacterium]MBU0885697.1 VWA domain-containing protein [Alphaproteobacteria bacterium]MBU1813784.1 VWA domain-containing protein [Alphaproteobacteria bacterium]MBU2091834.1 VWA domain-containing protein [Alphaproteobacteria bacterium]